MSHFSTLVIVLDVANEAAAEQAVEKLLAPYSEELAVEPYWKEMSADAIELMRAHYKETDLAKLAELMPHWEERPGRYEAPDKLFYETTYNPRSKWDWYAIGGRWNNVFGLGNQFKVADLPVNGFPFDEPPPFALLLPDGSWHERGQMGWWAIVSDEKSEDDWAVEFHKLLAPYRDPKLGAIAVLVDCHI